jgi:putative glutamine amidotransferase
MSAGVRSLAILEALEDYSLPFWIGVQWHPEYSISDADGRLFAAFVRAAQR